MADTILLPLNGELLALDMATFEAARQRGREIVPSPAPVQSATAEILDAQAMSQRTGVPASWFEQAAREGRIPVVHFGKYVRFDFQKVLEALASGARKDTLEPVRLRRRPAA